MSEEQCFSVEVARDMITDPRYKVDDFIGSGAMACVYKVSERGTPNIYALKLLREKYRKHQQFLDIFQTEAIHMRDLQYPNIVRFYKFVQEEHCAYILMDYVEGKPLTHEIQTARTSNGFIPLPKIVRIMAQIARAISYLHNEGYIHRDIKPGNVLLAGKDESALLTDLGIAGALDVQDMYGGAGTPSYMPYEQQTQGAIDQTVDTYAFGIMLFEMFTGRKPFIPEKGLSFKEARAAMIELHRAEPIPSIKALRPELPEAMDEIFGQALAKSPSDRYRDIMDFAQDIHEALLPFLPAELKDFEQIRPQEIIRSAKPEIIEVPATQPRFVLFGGIVSIIVITVLVALAVYFNNQTAPVVTPSPSPSIINSPDVTEAPSDTAESPTTIAASATPIVEEAPISIRLRDVEAIGEGFGDELNESLAEILRFNAPFVPLRSQTNFYIEVRSEANFGAYGIAFNIEADNYELLRLSPADNQWYLEAVQGDTRTSIQDGSFEALPSRIALSANGNRYQIEIDSDTFEYSGNDSNGETALYFAEVTPELLELQVGVIGETSSEDPAPLSPNRILTNEILALQASGDASAIVQCPAFVAAYEGLARYLNADSTREIAQNVQSISAFIYSRCLVADGSVDFNDSYSDYLAWENGLKDLLRDLEAP